MPKSAGRLTEKQARYLKLLPKSKTKKEAALKAGYSAQSAHNVKNAVEDGIGKTRMTIALERAGLTERKIAEVVKKATEADHPIYLRNGRGAKTEIKTVIRPDHGTRLRATEIAGRFRGDFVDRLHHSGNINLNDWESQLSKCTPEEIALIKKQMEPVWDIIDNANKRPEADPEQG